MFIEESFKTILITSIFGSIMVVFISIIKRMLGTKLSPEFNYYIWILLLIKLTIPYIPENKPSFYADIPTVQKISNTSNDMIHALIPDKRILDEKGKQIKNDKVDEPMMNLNNSNTAHKAKWFTLSSKVWFFGGCIIGVYLLIGSIRVKGIKSLDFSSDYEYNNSILRDCLNIVGTNKKVKLVITNKIDSPSITGLLKPVILLPESKLKELSIENKRHILIHELIHMKNKDTFINYTALFLSCIYWFNPLILWGFYKMKQDCEICCDAKVLTMLGTDEQISYGLSIIDAAKGRAKNLLVFNNVLEFSSKSNVRRRVIMIKKFKKSSKRKVLIGILTVILTGIISLSFNYMYSEADSLNINSASKYSLNKLGNIQKKSDNKTTSIKTAIVIYNSHPDEAFSSGITVKDVGTLFSNKLIDQGNNTTFIKCNLSQEEYSKAYEKTRNQIIHQKSDYDKSILLDIHRDSNDNPLAKEKTKTINLILAKGNPHYEKNREFAAHIQREIMQSLTGVKAEITTYKNGINYFNEDLSNKALVLEVGNERSSKEEIEQCINVFIKALNNVESMRN